MQRWRWPWQKASKGGEVMRWIVLDVETTGLDPARDRLLAVAGVAVHVQRGRPFIHCDDSFDVVLRDAAAHEPGLHASTLVPAQRHNILLHGIGLEARARGAAPAAALDAFERWVAGAPRLGFHVAFDRAVIERARTLAGSTVARAAASWLDIEALAAAAFPQVRAKALDEWLDHFGIPCLARHQASADVLATAELLLRLWPALQRDGATSFEAMRRLAASRRWAGG